MPAALTSTDASRSAAEGSDVTVRIQTAQDAVEAARAYAGSIAGKTVTRDRAGGVPYAELAALDASGLLAITVSRAFGGPELGATALAEVIATIAATDPAIAQVPQAHYLFTDVLAIRGTTRSPGSTTT